MAFCPGQPERPKSTVYTLKSKTANTPVSFLWDSPGSCNTSTSEYFIGRYIVSLCNAAMLTVRRAINPVCILLSSGFDAIVI